MFAQAGPEEPANAAGTVTAGAEVAVTGEAPSEPVAEAADGPTIDVTRFLIAFNRRHRDNPSVLELSHIRFELLETPTGFVAPRAGMPGRSVSFVDLVSAEPRPYHLSAIVEAARAVVRDLNGRGIVGAYVLLDPEQIDPTSRQDVRAPGDRTLRLVVHTGTVGELRSIGSGERVAEDDRINNPRHARIRERSPVRPLALDGAGAAAEGEEAEQPLLRKDLLDAYVLRLNRHPGRRVDVAVAPSGREDEAVLDFLVYENKPWSIYGQLSNTGTRQTSRLRQRFGFVHTQLTGNDDILSIDYITANFDKAHAVLASYDTPIGSSLDWRLRVFGSYSEFTASDVGLALEQFSGDSYQAGAEVVRNVYQDGPFFVDVFGGFRWQQVSVNNDFTQVGGEASFVAPRIGANFERRADASTFTAGIGLEYAFSGESRDELSRLGRLDPDRRWLVMDFNAAYSFYLEPLLMGAGWGDPGNPRSTVLAHEVALLMRGQHAFGNRLIPNAQGVAGGLFSVRGYPESVAAGDTLVVGTLEYRFHVPRTFGIREEPTQLFGREFRAFPARPFSRPDWDFIVKGFLDVGRTLNSDRRAFEDDETLVGLGVGVEVSLWRNLNFRVDWATALSEVNSAGVEVGDNRFHFLLTLLF